MAELAAGSEFAGHRIEAVAGRGGMGVVYRATQVALDRTVALKVIAPALVEDAAIRQRFVRESKLAASIDHPNVIPIYYTGEEDGVAYIAMRYVAGRRPAHARARERPARAAPRGAHRRPGRRRRSTPRTPPGSSTATSSRPTSCSARRPRLPDRLRPHQARCSRSAAGRPAGPLGRDARLRRARADPRRARRRARRRLRARLRALLRAHRATRRSSARATRRSCGRTSPRPRRARRDSVPGARAASFDEVIARATGQAPEDRFPSAGDLGRAALAAAGSSARASRERAVGVGAAAPVETPTESASARDAVLRRRL